MFLIVVVDMLFFQFNVKETKNNPLSDHMPGPEESWSGVRKNKNLPGKIPTLTITSDDKEYELIEGGTA